MPPLKTEPTPIDLEKTTRNTVAVLNRLTGFHRPLPFDWDGRPAILEFVPCPPSVEVVWILQLELDGEPIEVGLSEIPEISWISPELAGVRLDGLPEELAAAVLQNCLETTLREIQALPNLEVVGLKADRDPAPKCAGSISIGWMIARGNETHWITGTMSAELKTMEALASMVERVTPSPAGSVTEIPVVLDFSIGKVACSADEIRNLKLNDILLADLEVFSADLSCEIFAGTRPLGRGKIVPGGVVITEVLGAPDSLFTEEADSVEMPGAGAFREIGGSLECLVARRSIPSGKLSRIHPGLRLGMSVSKDPEMILLSGGKKIGAGRCLQVGDRQGIRITDLATA